MVIQFEWDPKKDKSNLEKHGISFSEAKLVFFSPRINWQDTRRDYGEDRFITVGTIAPDLIVTVAYTLRNQNIRIISVRVANKKETRRYYAIIKKKNRSN